MKKRILGVLLVCVMVFSLLTACGKEEEKPASNSGTTNNTTNNATNMTATQTTMQEQPKPKMKHPLPTQQLQQAPRLV